MKYLKRIFLIIIFIFLFLRLPILATPTSNLPEEVKKTIQDRIEYGNNVGIVVGIIDSEGSRYYGYGKMAVTSDKTPDEHTVFEIGSITKVFTSILLARLVEENMLAPDDPIEKFLPESVKVPIRNDKHITLQHLATHTSGLPRMPDNFSPADPDNPYADYSVGRLYEFLSNHQLQRDIGARYEYSNYGAGLLGHLLALVNGTTYEALLQQKITKVLGMEDTRITLAPEMKTRLARGHAGGVQVSNWDIPTLAGAGALRSTVRDMDRFLRANMGLINTSLYSAMQKTHEPKVEAGSSSMQVGLGWHIRMSDNSKIIWHNGGTGGYRSFAGFIKEEQKGVIVLTNSRTSVDDIGFHLLDSRIPLGRLKRSLAIALRSIIDEKGIEAGIQKYHALKKNQFDKYNFSESELNLLGYQYLQKGDFETAITIFKLNVETFPKSANVYDSLGEAYMELGDTERSILNYKKSLRLNSGNENAREMLAKQGVKKEDPSSTITSETLESYVGTYQIAPNFYITISREENRLMAQATGQQQFEIFPMSETKFYYRVVNAQITFNKNESGIVESLTLHQNDRDIPGKKVRQ